MTDDSRRRHGRSKADRRRHEPPDVGKFRRECRPLKDFAEPNALPRHLLQRLNRPVWPAPAPVGNRGKSADPLR